jgi:hypothetical protein
MMGKLKDKYAKPGNSYADMRWKYNMLINQRYSMAIPLAMYVGGIYIDRSFVGQNPSYSTVCTGSCRLPEKRHWPF